MGFHASLRVVGLFALLLVGVPARAELPVEEVTVFKDGHALLLRTGSLPVREDGSVVLDRLPRPVLGTFWPFADEQGATLRSVRAGTRRVAIDQTALEIADLLAANPGAAVVVTDVDGRTFSATVVGFPARSGEELEVAADDAEPRLPVRGRVVFLRDENGVRALPVDRIREVVFPEEMNRTLAVEQFRSRLTLGLAWEGARGATARVGFLALEDGLRWIPSYRVDLLDGGEARVSLQATIVNDVADLDDVGVNLVIGVPTFTFAGMVDPIALEQAVAEVARRMPPTALGRRMLSNAIMTQMSDPGAGTTYEDVPTPAVVGGAQNEDLYVFRVEHVTVAKGERIVVPVAEITLPYTDVFKLDVPFAPPPEVWPQIAQRLYQNREQAELARFEAAPRVMHEARLRNEGPHPLTTAPALLFRNGRILAQGMMTYTSVGNSVDLAITAAVDVHVRKRDREEQRNPDAVRWQGDQYARIDMAGTLTLTNYLDGTVHLEVTRSLLGSATGTEPEGVIEGVNAMEDGGWARGPQWRPPYWWAWYSWPYWWYHFNSVSRLRWTLDLDPGKSLDLTYRWSYYWR